MARLLRRSFYDRDVLTVAREVLGMRLVRLIDGRRLSGIITEAEAYRHQEDLACHAHAGMTKRNRVMFGPPAHAYVYFTYGMHWMLNLVCEADTIPAAVLIRAIQPVEGLDVIAANRPDVPLHNRTNGPAKLTKALQINGDHNGLALTSRGSGLFLEEGDAVADEFVLATPRIGIQYAPEPWLSNPWRFVVQPAFHGGHHI